MSQEHYFLELNKSKHLPVKLVIYDFDQTITCDHLYHELDGGHEDELKKMSDDKLLHIFGGIDRQKRLIQHFERIESTNCELIIISFGWVKVIKNALKRMSLYKYFNTIIGKDSELLKNCNGSKAQCISKLKSNKKLRSDQILFIDDDNANIGWETRYCDSIWIQQGKGMSNKHMKHIENKCNGIESTPPQQNDKLIYKFDEYKIKNIPKWYHNVGTITRETTVDSDDEINVAMLNIGFDNYNGDNKNVQKRKESPKPTENAM